MIAGSNGRPGGWTTNDQPKPPALTPVAKRATQPIAGIVKTIAAPVAADADADVAAAVAEDDVTTTGARWVRARARQSAPRILTSIVTAVTVASGVKAIAETWNGPGPPRPTSGSKNPATVRIEAPNPAATRHLNR